LQITFAHCFAGLPAKDLMRNEEKLFNVERFGGLAPMSTVVQEGLIRPRTQGITLKEQIARAGPGGANTPFIFLDQNDDEPTIPDTIPDTTPFVAN
jgi:hypothetical protein